jgi:hypothetical protein
LQSYYYAIGYHALFTVFTIVVSLSLSLSRTHTHTRSLSLSLSLSLSNTLSLSLELSRINELSLYFWNVTKKPLGVANLLVRRIPK